MWGAQLRVSCVAQSFSFLIHVVVALLSMQGLECSAAECLNCFMQVVAALLSMPSLAAVHLTHSPWHLATLPGAAVEALAARLVGSGLHLTVDPSAIAAAEAQPRHFGPEATTASTDVDT